MTLRLQMIMGFARPCAFPPRRQAELPLPAQGEPPRRAVSRPRRGCPVAASIGEASAPAIVAVRRETADRTGARDRGCGGAARRRVDLFAEGPTPKWALPLPSAGGRRAERHPSVRFQDRRSAAGHLSRRWRHAEADGGRRRSCGRDDIRSRLIGLRWSDRPFAGVQSGLKTGFHFPGSCSNVAPAAIAATVFENRPFNQCGED